MSLSICIRKAKQKNRMAYKIKRIGYLCKTIF